jgi:hypothetical protein
VWSSSRLFRLPMGNMLTATTAELLELETLGRLLLVLGRHVITFLAFGALKYYVVSHFLDPPQDGILPAH